MALSGYMGKFLFIDVGSGRVRREPLDPDAARAFLGGFGLNIKFAYELLPPGVDPLSPQNVIIFGVGPLTGTLAPGSARISVTTKFPLSGTIGGGNGGVRMGALIKLAGYDGIVVSGRAAEPVYLRIADERVDLVSAKGLWGKDIYEATNELGAKHPGAGVLAIGQAGENQCKFALAMMDRVAATGRGGLGAVMGAKNLKAIVVSGTQDVTVADPKRFMKAVNRYFDRIRNYPLHPEWIAMGMQRTWADVLKRDGFVRPFRGEVVPTSEVDRVCGVSAYLKFRKGNFACFSCPMADKEILEIKEEGSEGLITYTSSFSGKLESLATILDNPTTEQLIRCMNATNRYGLDNHDLVGVMDLVIHLYERGIITATETKGLTLKRDFETAMRLIQWTATREDLGDVMAEGMDAVCRRFGLDPEDESFSIKGWRTLFDPRVTGMGTMEFEMVVNPRGGHHTSGGGPAYARGSSTEKFASHANRMGAPDEAIHRILDPALGFNAGRFTRYSEDWYAVLNSLGMCVRLQMNRFHSIGSLAELYSSATGLETSARELARAGERTWNLLKAWNVREGFTRKDDRFPPRWFEPLETPGGKKLELHHYFGQPLGREGADRMLDDYYDERGWDPKSGNPTRAKLSSLGLEWVAQDLERRGIIVPGDASGAAVQSDKS
jgi:aldehyde:ferredoxin oxidoreductase